MEITVKVAPLGLLSAFDDAAAKAGNALPADHPTRKQVSNAITDALVGGFLTADEISRGREFVIRIDPA